MTQQCLFWVFRAGKTRKQAKCPSMGDGVQRTWCIYSMEDYSAIRKGEMLPCATTWMDLEQNKRSQSENQEPYNFTYMWNIKLKAPSEQTRKTNKQKLIDTDKSVTVTRGKMGRERASKE